MDCSSATSYWGRAFFGPSSCWGISTCRASSASKLVGDSELPSFCAKLFEDFDCKLLFCFKLLRGYDSEALYILNTPTPLIWCFRFIKHIFKYGPLMWRFRFIIHLKHAPSFGDSGSSYILNVATSLDDCDSSYISNTPLVWFSRSSYLLSTPSGSSYMFNTPPHMAIPVHHVS